MRKTTVISCMWKTNVASQRKQTGHLRKNKCGISEKKKRGISEKTNVASQKKQTWHFRENKRGISEKTNVASQRKQTWHHGRVRNSFVHTFAFHSFALFALLKRVTRANRSHCSYKKSDSNSEKSESHFCSFTLKKWAIHTKSQRENSQPCIMASSCPYTYVNLRQLRVEVWSTLQSLLNNSSLWTINASAATFRKSFTVDNIL